MSAIRLSRRYFTTNAIACHQVFPARLSIPLLLPLMVQNLVGALGISRFNSHFRFSLLPDVEQSRLPCWCMRKWVYNMSQG